jgi:carboxymethylenebutenolidase
MGNICHLGPDTSCSLGYMALPDMRAGPGVLLLHAWWGLTLFFRAVCERLANEGFVALAPDLYHGATAATPTEAKQLRFGLNDEQANREMEGALRCLQSQPSVSGTRVGVVGFSMGGYLALRLARRVGDALGAAVIFYATEGGSFETAQTPVLGHFAAGDGCWAGARAMASLEERLHGAGCETAFHVYPDTQHAFFEQDRPEAYHAQAADLAWRRTIAFLRAHLAVPLGAYVTLRSRARACEWTVVGLG